MSDAPHEAHRKHAPTALAFAVITISDSRRGGQDMGGALCVDLMQQAGHTLTHRVQVADEATEIQAAVEASLARGAALVLTTGGTGLAPRDVTPEAILPMLEREIPGFGELFRMLSYQEVGTAAVASRAFAGILRGSLVVALPGSPAAVELAVTRIVLPEAAHIVSQARRASAPRPRAGSS